MYDNDNSILKDSNFASAFGVYGGTNEQNDDEEEEDENNQELDAFGVSVNPEDEAKKKRLILQTTPREKLYALLTIPSSSLLARIFWAINLLFCIGYILTFVIETEPRYLASTDDIGFFIANTIFVGFFMIEFLLRLLTAPKLLPFFFNFVNICDILAIAPYWVQVGIAGMDNPGTNASWIRIFHLCKIPRILLLVRADSILILRRAVRYSIHSLVILSLAISVVMIIGATFFFYAETSDCYFDKETEAWYYNPGTILEGQKTLWQSIPHSLWLMIVTITTTGYGEAPIVAPLGRLTISLIIILAYFIILFPLSFVGGYLLRSFFEAGKVNPVGTNKETLDHFVPAMRPCRKQLDKIENIISNIENSMGQLKRKSNALGRSLSLFDTQFSDALVDYESDNDNN